VTLLRVLAASDQRLVHRQLRIRMRALLTHEAHQQPMYSHPALTLLDQTNGPQPPQTVRLQKRIDVRQGPAQQVPRHRFAWSHACHPGQQRDRDAIDFAFAIETTQAERERLRDALHMAGRRYGVLQTGAE